MVRRLVGLSLCAASLVGCEAKLAGPSTDSVPSSEGGPSLHDGPRPDHPRAGDGPRRDRGTDARTTPTCQAIAGVTYGTLSISSPTAGDMSKHGDVNMLLRKKRTVSETKGLVNLSGATDPKLPPQLYSLFTDDRVPVFPNVYQLEAWDWSCNCPNGYMTDPAVTLAGMTTQAGEVVQAPKSAYDVGGGHTAIVLYAAPGTITLKYTIEDNVVKGYTVHLGGICIEPSLQKLYDQCQAGGRKQLPALKGRQALGRAVGTEIQAAIRDTGSWMDPRSRKDWWQGK